MTGRLLGIARRAAPRAPMETLASAGIGIATGVTGDWRGKAVPGKSNRRQVTLLSLQRWQDALAALGSEADGLDWTARRANLLIDGLDPGRRVGDVVMIGTVELEITGETDPCRRMDEVKPGLMQALVPEWRGGVTCRVLSGGQIALGDIVTIRTN